jgi:hypothetical protein
VAVKGEVQVMCYLSQNTRIAENGCSSPWVTARGLQMKIAERAGEASRALN